MTEAAWSQTALVLQFDAISDFWLLALLLLPCNSAPSMTRLAVASDGVHVQAALSLQPNATPETCLLTTVPPSCLLLY